MIQHVPNKLALHFGYISNHYKISAQYEIRMYDYNDTLSVLQGCPRLNITSWSSHYVTKFEACEAKNIFEGQTIRALIRYNHWPDFLWLHIASHILDFNIIVRTKIASKFWTSTSKAHPFFKPHLKPGPKLRAFKWRTKVTFK